MTILSQMSLRLYTKRSIFLPTASTTPPNSQHRGPDNSQSESTTFFDIAGSVSN